jgi:hypothetical protein
VPNKRSHIPQQGLTHFSIDDPSEVGSHRNRLDAQGSFRQTEGEETRVKSVRKAEKSLLKVITGWQANDRFNQSSGLRCGHQQNLRSRREPRSANVRDLIDNIDDISDI